MAYYDFTRKKWVEGNPPAGGSVATASQLQGAAGGPAAGGVSQQGGYVPQGARIGSVQSSKQAPQESFLSKVGKALGDVTSTFAKASYKANPFFAIPEGISNIGGEKTKPLRPSEVLPNMVVGAARAVPQSGTRIFMQATGQKSDYKPDSPGLLGDVERFLVGDKPVKPFSGYPGEVAGIAGEGAEKWVNKNLPESVRTGLGVGLSALDAFPLGVGKVGRAGRVAKDAEEAAAAVRAGREGAEGRPRPEPSPKPPDTTPPPRREPPYTQPTQPSVAQTAAQSPTQTAQDRFSQIQQSFKDTFGPPPALAGATPGEFTPPKYNPPEFRENVNLSKTEPPFKPTDQTPRLRESGAAQQADEATSGVPQGRVSTQERTTDPFKQMSQAAEAERTRYAKPSKARELESGVIKYAPATRMDARYAKATGSKLDEIPAQRSMEHLAQVADNSDVPAVQYLRDFGITDKIKKYTPGTQAELDFNNYRNAKRIVEIHEKLGLDTTPEFNGQKVNIKQLQNRIKQYESDNPSALKDLEEMKPWADNQVDRMVEAGRLTKQEGEIIKGSYKFYSPQGRVQPEELARATIGARNRTGGARNVIKELEGGSGALDDTWNTIIERAFSAERQIQGNPLGNELYRRIEEGKAPGSIVLSEQQSARIGELQDLLKDLAPLRKTLAADARKIRVKGRVQKIRTEQAEKGAAGKAKEKLKALIPKEDTGSLSAIDSLSTPELMDALEQMGSKSRVSLKAKSNRQYSSQLESQLNEIKSQIEDFGQFSKELQTEKWGLSPDTTGRQIVSFRRNGRDVKIEVDPETATFLQGLGNDQKEHVATLLQEIQRPFRATYTGWLNPTFAIKSFLHYDAPMVLVNSKQGVRALLSANSNKELVKSISSSSEFQQELRRFGANQVGGSLLPTDARLSSEVIAAEGSLVKQAKLAIKSRKARMELSHKYDILGGKLAAGRRSQIAAAHYHAKYGAPFKKSNELENPALHKEAMADASWAYNNVMPNYQATGKIIRMVDSIVPYTGAGAAGTRSFLTALRRRPARTTAVLTGVFVVPATVMTLHNLGSQEGKDFYKDMVDSGNEQILNNNHIIVLPGASKDKDTGAWSGIIKIPIAPEFRGLNEGLWKNMVGLATGQGLDPVAVAKAALNTVTGGFAQSSGINPAVRVGAGLWTNVDPQTGREVVSGDMKSLPRKQQSTSKTSDSAKILSDLASSTGIPWIKDLSPVQADFVLSQLGLPGKVAKGANPAKDFTEQYTKATGKSAGRKYFESADKEKNSLIVTAASDSDEDIKKAAKETRERQAVYQAYLDKAAEKDDPWYSVTFNTLLAGHPEVVDALTRLYKSQDSHAPFWDLDPDKQKQVIRIRTLHPHWTGLAAPADEAMKDVLNKQPWYKDFLKSQDDYFNSLPQDVKDKAKSEEQGTYHPEATPDVQAKLDQLSGITDSKQRSEFYKNNPDVSDYFTQLNQAEQKQREAMGLMRDVTPEQESALSEYERLKRIGQEKGFVKQHPELGTFFGTTKAIGAQAELLGATAEGRTPDASKIGSTSGKIRIRRGGRGKGAKLKIGKSKFSGGKKGRVSLKKPKSAKKLTVAGKPTGRITIKRGKAAV